MRRCAGGYRRSKEITSKSRESPYLMRWQWPWCGLGVDQTERPLDGFRVHLLDPRIVPVLGNVAEGGIENASFTIRLRPGHGKVSIGPVDFLVGEIQL